MGIFMRGREESFKDVQKIVGYYAAWAVKSGFTPDKIDSDKVTHLNYAFADIGDDLKIHLGFPEVDPANFEKLNELKRKNPKLKTLISVGGWTWSGKFSDAALTEKSRSGFADSCVAFILKYGFDGIDLDWEYPVGKGLSTNKERPEDKQNFTLLLKAIRDRLNQQSRVDGKEYLLTIAGGPGQWYVDNTQLDILHHHIDYATLMTYDIHGTSGAYSDFNAPLYDNSDSSPHFKWSVDASVKAWLGTGFPQEKLIVGVPFYGHKYDFVNNANNGLYQTFSGGDFVEYHRLVNTYLSDSGYTRYYHRQSMVPWLFNGSSFISYDDEESIELKANYIKAKKLGGAAIWELSHDPGKVLLSVLNKLLK
ncbi:MAG: glycoside hydrolase family 18 [Eubacterium sp.]|jgi:chitinase|nr:glycoside hydrolase family 18 [Eubacterium sp.]